MIGKALSGELSFTRTGLVIHVSGNFNNVRHFMFFNYKLESSGNEIFLSVNEEF